MKIKIEYSAQLKKGIGVSEEEWDFHATESLREILDRVAAKHSKAMSRFAAEGGSALDGFLIALNDEQVFPDSPQTLNDGDVLSLMTPMAGG